MQKTAFVWILVIVSILGQVKAQRIITDQEVLDTAQANLSQFIDMIDFEYEKYGFDNMNELNLIELGAPYEVVSLSSDFVTDAVFDSPGKYFTLCNSEWWVPLMIDDSIRCWMFVDYLNDTLKVVGGGGADGCRRFDHCEKINTIPAGLKRYILNTNVIYLNCSFIMTYDPELDNYSFYPVSKDIPGLIDCTDHESYSKHDSFEDFFVSYHSVTHSLELSSLVGDNYVTIYPNPVVNKLNIKSKEPILQLDIFDSKGMKVQTYILKEAFLNIDITLYKQGIYYVLVRTRKMVSCNKFIKSLR